MASEGKSRCFPSASLQDPGEETDGEVKCQRSAFSSRLVPAGIGNHTSVQLSASGSPGSTFPFSAGGDVTGIVSTLSRCRAAFKSLLIRSRWAARGVV